MLTNNAIESCKNYKAMRWNHGSNRRFNLREKEYIRDVNLLLAIVYWML